VSRYIQILLIVCIPLFSFGQLHGNKRPRIQEKSNPIITKAGTPEELPLTFMSNFANYSVVDGLSHSAAFSVFVDSRQIVWVGTYGGGLNKFDGLTFESYDKSDGLTNNVVWKILEDPEGNIWIATDGGLHKFDGQRFELKVGAARMDGNEIVRAFCHGPNNTFWLGNATNGAYQYDYVNDTIVDSVSPEQLYGGENVLIYDLEVDHEENLWCGLNREGVSKYDGESIINYTEKDGLGYNIVLDVMCDDQGRIWVCSGHGISRFNGETFDTFDTTDGLVGDISWTSYQSANGDIIIGSFYSGVTIYNDEKGFYKTYTKNEGLQSQHVTSIAEDNNGNVWFASNDFGLSKLEGQAFKHFYPDIENDDLSVFDILEAKNGTYWFASDIGLLKLENNQLYKYSRQQGLEVEAVICLSEDSKGNLWFGTPVGVFRFDGKYFAQYTEDYKKGLSNPVISDVFVDKEDVVWAATGGGVNSIKNDTIAWYQEPQGLSYYLSKAAYLDKKGNKWFGTYGGGVSVIPAGKTRADTSQFIRMTEEQGFLTTNYVPVISEDRDGNVWLNNYGESVVIVKSNWQEIQDTSDWFVQFDHSNGLLNANLAFMEEDDKGDMWLGTVNGVDRVKKAANAVKTGVFEVTHYGLEEGYKGISSHRNASLKDSKGYLWLSAGNLVTRYNPDEEIEYPTIPLTRITGLRLFFEEVQWDSLEGVTYEGFSKWDNIPQELSLPYTQNHLTFDFKGISHYMPQNIRYQWILEGFDEIWSPISNKHEATYSGLSAGDYTFKVKTFHSQFPSRESTATFQFTIRPPFWATWWFRISVLLIIVLGLFGLFKWRTRALKNRQKILEKTVEERTHEVIEQKEVVEEQHQEIMDSITYAKRIQHAILPSEDLLDAALPNHFIYYEPKDIVAGDFYWLETIDDLVIIAAADCTGHGVPGAMVSVVCHNALNRAVREFALRSPSKILDKTRELVIETLAKRNKEVKDGMDVALCVVDKKTNKLIYSGANNPLWVVRKNDFITEENKENKSTYPGDKFSLIEFKPNKQPIGQYADMKPFEEVEIDLKKDDSYYFFTDGYADQFGGEKGKKLKYKPFKKILLELAEMPMKDQKIKLSNQFEEWKGKFEQVDDVCVIGMKI